MYFCPLHMYMYNYCTLSSQSGSNHTLALQTMPTNRTIRANPLSTTCKTIQEQQTCTCRLISGWFETRLCQYTVDVDTKININAHYYTLGMQCKGTHNCMYDLHVHSLHTYILYMDISLWKIQTFTAINFVKKNGQLHL